MKKTSRRGGKLREHILWVAKDIFLEMGFERTSMDVVAARAKTSKRSLYAHFENKEKLFHAFFELMCGFFLERIGSPDDYSTEPAEALVQFCGRYLELLLFDAPIRMCRLAMAEADRFPEVAADSFKVLMTTVQDRVTAHLAGNYGLSVKAGRDTAQKLLAQVIHPRFPRTLFGVDKPSETIDFEKISPAFDLKPVRRAVVECVESISKKRNV